MKVKKLCLALSGAMILTLSTLAGVISVNFTEGAVQESHMNQQISAGTIAGVYPRANWNNTITVSGNVDGLTNDLGEITTANLTWSSGGAWGDNDANSDADARIGDAQLARGFLNDGNEIEITVSGIPYATYTVVLHMSTSDVGGSYNPATIDGIEYFTTGTKIQYVSGSNWMGYNTIVVSNLSNNIDLSIHLPSQKNAIRSCIAGIQIVESSEGAPPPEISVSPNWLFDPIKGQASIAEAYNNTLANKAMDRNGDLITFTKVSGPAWLTVSSDGTLSGTPAANDSGINTFVVAADDGTTTPTQSTLIITIEEKDWTIAWNFTERWFSTALLNAGVVYGTDQWTDCVDLAADSGHRPANSTDPWAVTHPINAAMVEVAWSSPNLWSGGNNDDSLEQRVYKLYLDDGGTGPMVTVSGLGDWMSAAGASSYTIEFYQGCSDDNNTFPTLNIYDGTGTGGRVLESMEPMVAAGDGAYPFGTGATGSRLDRSAKSIFIADTITFHTARDGNNRAGISGFIITPHFDYIPDVPVSIILTGPSFSGEGMELSWEGKTGKLYGIETTSNLLSGGWLSYTSGIEGVGNTIIMTIPMVENQLFYRVISE